MREKRQWKEKYKKENWKKTRDYEERERERERELRKVMKKARQGEKK